MGLTPDYRIAGDNVNTELIREHLTSISISDEAGQKNDTCTLTFDTSNNLGLPGPALADTLQQRMPRLHRVLENKFYVDELYQKIFVARTINIGNGLWKKADAGLIDGWLVNGSARLMGNLAARIRVWQSGYLFHYAFAMIIGLIGILAIWVML